MSNYTDTILQLIQKNAGLRATQISDRLDIDLEIVENTIAKAVRDGQVEATETVGPNKLATNTYCWIGAAPLNWTAPLVGAASAPEAPAETQAVTTGESAQPAAAAAAPEHRRSKAGVALEYLAERGPTTRKDLAKVMGLPNQSQVASYMRPHLQSGKVACIDGIYCIPDGPVVVTGDASKPERAAVVVVAAAPAAVAAAVAAEQAKVPTVKAVAGIELNDILRAKMTPEELRGYFKGNAIRCLLEAEHSGGAEDYRMGCLYANLLAEATVAHAA